MKKLSKRDVYLQIAIQDKHRRLNKLSMQQAFFLTSIALWEIHEETGELNPDPLTEDFTLRAIKYQYKSLSEKGYLVKEGDEYKLSEKSHKMFDAMHNDPGTEFQK